jgi:hypothetical protein
MSSICSILEPVIRAIEARVSVLAVPSPAFSPTGPDDLTDDIRNRVRPIRT